MTAQVTTAPSPPGRATAAARLAFLALALASSGATCTQRLRGPVPLGDPAAPSVLTAGASAAQIVAAVNANTGRVHSYVAPNASISLPSLPVAPLLSGNIAYERPRRFRLRAGTVLSGSEVDIGSNDERFWMWSKRNEPPAMLHARHDQYAASAARGALPIEPSWLVEALGLVTVDQAAASATALPRGNGLVELRWSAQGPSGLTQRVMVVDAARAWVVEQHVYDAAGQLLASARAERFRYFEQAQASLPQVVHVSVPAAGLDLRIDVGTPSVNVVPGDANQLWAMPVIQGCPQVDLVTGATTTDLAAVTPAAPAPPGAMGSVQGAPAAALYPPPATPLVQPTAPLSTPPYQPEPMRFTAPAGGPAPQAATGQLPATGLTLAP